MSNGRPISDELRPYVDRADVEAVDEVGEQLRSGRPAPSPAFRAELRSSLIESESKGGLPWRPRRLRAAATAYAASGLVLLGIAALGAAGGGPLGY